MVLGITARLNKFTPGMSFGRFAHKVLYKGVGCGYIEEAGKRKYVLTPVLEKLERKLELNDFSPYYPKPLEPKEFDFLKKLLKPLISNEKGLKKLNCKTLRYSPSPAAVMVWGDNLMPVITIVKQMRHPTREIFFHRFPFLRRVWRITPSL